MAGWRSRRAQVDERTLREIYFPAFERVVREANPATVMCSYNKVNGIYASQNHWLLTDVLRSEWGFDGYVVSDWGAVVDPVAAVAAGLDLEMPSSGDRSPHAITAAVRAGNLDEGLLNQAVSRVIAVHERLRADQAPDVSVDFDAHHALARAIATDGAVLLANEGNLLPLSSSEGARSPSSVSSPVRPVTRVREALTPIPHASTTLSLRSAKPPAGLLILGFAEQSSSTPFNADKASQHLLEAVERASQEADI